MKQTVTANVGGIAFHIDEDAYSTLSTYLREIENHLHESDSKTEIMQDIEARIAELFKQHLNFSHLEVVNLAMVQDVVNQLGQPEVISDGMEEPQDTEDEDNTETGTPGEQPKPAFRKRLYRDVANQSISGVCAGLGKYIGVDAIWFKLLFLFFTFFNGVGLLAYVILWIIMQPADTAARRLEMQGIEPSAENIKAEVERQRIYQESHPYKPRRSSASNIAYGCLITLLCLCGIPLIIAIIAIWLIFVFTQHGLNLIAFPFLELFGLGTQVASAWIILLCILLLFLIPIITFVIWLIRRKNNPVKKRFWVTMLILWLLSLLGTCISASCLCYTIVNIKVDKTTKERLKQWAKDVTGNTATPWEEEWDETSDNIIEEESDSINSNCATDLSETGVLEVVSDTI